MPDDLFGGRPLNKWPTLVETVPSLHQGSMQELRFPICPVCCAHVPEAYKAQHVAWHKELQLLSLLGIGL